MAGSLGETVGLKGGESRSETHTDFTGGGGTGGVRWKRRVRPDAIYGAGYDRDRDGQHDRHHDGYHDGHHNHDDHDHDHAAGTAQPGSVRDHAGGLRDRGGRRVRDAAEARNGVNLGIAEFFTNQVGAA
jgi:hypothetical protein